MSVEKETLERRLTADDIRRILQSLGFHINGEKPNKEGWITGVLGPPELGEGKRGNFSVNAETGYAMNFGSPEWKGSLYDAVMDVRGCTFPGALEWVAEQIGYRSNGHAKSPLSVERLAKAKGLPPKLLRKLGVEQTQPGKLRITYRDRDGSAATARQRLRTALSAKNGSLWEKGSEPIVPYGLWLLDRMSARHSYCLGLEGESDPWTAWKNGFPALGIPGKAMHGTLKLEHVEDFERLYVGIEADEAGHDFARNMHERLKEIGYKGDVYALPFSEDAPDLNDLYRDDSDRFEERLERMMKKAPILDEWLQDPADDPNEPRKEMTQSERLLSYVSDVELFSTPDGEAYASFEAGGAYLTAAISSPSFGSILRRRFYQAEGRPPSSQALQDARDVLAARAEFDGEETEVHLRVAGHDGKIYIDLADDRSNIVEIDAKGWRIVGAEKVPVKFRRTPGMKALPEPKRGGGLDLLRSHVRLASDGEFALLLAWLVQSLRPDGRSYPGLELTGEQGSGKTFTAKILRAIIDPHRVPTRTRPREERDLMVAAHNSWVLSFDNLSGLPHWLSDALCRLATGGGMGVRKLYRNRIEELFYAMRPLILNGIEDLTTQPDLADRTITLRLEPIPESERQTETALQEAFERDRPLVLGALFDAVATALKNIDDVELDRLPRMADFACWGVAAEPAFPVEEGTFMDAYNANRAEASEEAVANDTVAAAIQRMLSEEGSWEGIMSELLVDLKEHLPNPERPPHDFPDTHQAMTARLRRVLPALRAVGIDRKDLPRTSGGRPFRLYQASATHDAMDGATSANRTEKSTGSAPDQETEIDYRGKSASPVSPRHKTPPAGAENGYSDDALDDTGKEARQGASQRDTGNRPSRAAKGENDTHDAHDTVLPHQSKPVLEVPSPRWERWPLASGRYASTHARRRVELDSARIGDHETFDIDEIF